MALSMGLRRNVLHYVRGNVLHNVLFNRTPYLASIAERTQNPGYRSLKLVNSSILNTSRSETSPKTKLVGSNCQIEEVSKLDKRLIKLVWNDGSFSRFPYIFLRENCKCLECFEPTSKQRKVDILRQGVDISVQEAGISDSGAGLECLWPDGHRSVFSADWLYERRMPEAKGRKSAGEANKIVNDDLVCWDRNQMEGEIPGFDYNTVMNDDRSLFDFLYTFYRHGLALLNDAPNSAGISRELAARIGYIQLTHYGDIFDVKSKDDPSNLAYTNEYLPFHLDLPFLTRTPEVQVLHCIEQVPENAGGESLFVDAFLVAKKLMEVNYEAFEMLCNTPVCFGDVGTDFYGEFCIGFSRTIIELNKHKRLQRIMYNNHVRQDKFENLTPEEILKYYESYREFVEILYLPENTVQHRLKPGQLVMFHNTRVLHSRAMYTRNAGSRWLQGCYIDWDTIFSKLRVLRGKLTLETPHLHANTNDFF